MKPRTARFVLALGVSLLLPGVMLGATPEEILAQIDGTRLDPARAVHVEDLDVDTRTATLRIDSGTLYPATPVDGRVVEMVFIGDATLRLDPGDAIERSQLELFTGSEILEEPITEAVMVVCFDAGSDALFARERLVEPDPKTESRARELFDEWKGSTERKILDVRASLLMDALGEADYGAYFAGQFRSDELGLFTMLFDPDSNEQLSLGKFERIEVDDKEKRKTARFLERQQRKGRLMGMDVQDLGTFDQWILTSLKDESGRPLPGRAAFEARQYDLDVTIDNGAKNLTGTATLRLESTRGTRRVVRLRMASDVLVEKVVGPAGAELLFLQEFGAAFVVLGEPPERGSTVELRVDFAGAMFSRVDSKVLVLRDTTNWYPHVGDSDRATYSVKLTWPRGLDLLASGKLMDSGELADGRHWQRRTLDVPVTGFTFEVGKFKTREFDVGDIRVTLGFDRLTHGASEKWVRDQIAAAIEDSLRFYEVIYGPYPLDHLTVVTVHRGFAQGLLGFVTLPGLLGVNLGIVQELIGWEDRRTVIAHELAHQWWGNLVGWKSYRDQWLSEAMANYAAMIWARSRLAGVEFRGPIDDWQEILVETTEDGRPIESVGPLTLGQRLSSTKADAYEAIVYQKGAVVLSMLGYVIGERRFLAAQKQMIEVARFREVSTDEFVEAMEKMTGVDLEAFSRQYIHGTGLPEVLYRYEIGEQREGAWPVKIVAHQQTPYRYRYRAEPIAGGRFDVRTTTLGQIDVAESTLVVPVQVSVHDPDAPLGGKPGHKNKKSKRQDPQANAIVEFRLLLRGETADPEISLDLEPEEVWLDRDNVVFGRFFSEDREPKRALLYRAVDAAAAGDVALAEKLFRQTVETELGEVPNERLRQVELDLLNTHAHLQLAELLLDQGRIELARESVALAGDSVSGARRRGFNESFQTLDARILMLEGDFGGALKKLKSLAHRGRTMRGAEGYVLMAIAARQVGDAEAYAFAAEAASRRGADLSALGE